MTGTIRVAVVATGTDATMVQALEPMKANASRAPLAVKRQYAPEPAPQAASEQEFEADVRHAVAEAITRHEPEPAPADDGITVEPYIPSAALDPLDEPVRMAETPVPSLHVPQAERPQGQMRMPRTEELPAVARKTLVAQERQDSEPRNARALFSGWPPMSGSGCVRRRPRSSREPRAVGRRCRCAQRHRGRSAPESGRTQAPEGAAGLDAHGRAQPQREHIEIPSFLRKHG